MFPARLAHFLRPDAGLDFTDVGLVEQYHTQTALAYTAANAEGEFAVE